MNSRMAPRSLTSGWATRYSAAVGAALSSAFQAAHPDIKVQVVSGSTGPITERVTVQLPNGNLETMLYNPSKMRADEVLSRHLNP
jgi:ABC-type glycerol-3-phosphate transport system substrate-binding protein